MVIDNYPEDQVENFECPNHPQNPAMGSRRVPFSRMLYIERDDFHENPPKKYYRLGPGREVRLRYSYIIKCVGTVKDDKTGEVVEVHCTYDPETRNGPPRDGRRVEGVIHWVSADHSNPAEVRLYDRLFQEADPASRGDDFTQHLNPGSLDTFTTCRVESSLLNAEPGSRFQFERLGYFCIDSEDSIPGKLVFNRIVPLRDTWAKVAGQGKG
jgi:glutaminyl-tRNA synthetase